jgi:Protein of unknown function (DUF5818)
MNKVKLTALLLVLCAAVFLAAKDKANDSSPTFQGAIVDSQCAFNVHSQSHSHDWMIAKGVDKAHDEKSCTLHCVKDMGGSYVLVSKKEVYRLDDQSKAEPFAGKDVKVSGTLDAKTRTIHVVEIAESK